MRWSQLVLAAVAIAVGIGLAHATLNRARPGRASGHGTPQPAAEEQDVRIFAGGIVEGARPEISLGFEISGRLRKVRVREGDPVQAGDVLAELETEDAELRLAEARAQLRLAVAERDNLLAASAPGRAAPLAADGAGSASSGQVAERRRPTTTPTGTATAGAELAIAEAKVTLAETGVERELRALAKASLRSPCDGVLLAAVPQAGELVGPADRELFTLVDTRQIRVRAFIEEFDALRVAEGQRATVTAVGAPNRPYAGIVQSCAPGMHPKSHPHFKPGELLDVRVREIAIELDDGAGLLIGLPVEVFIEPRQPSTAEIERREDGDEDDRIYRGLHGN